MCANLFVGLIKTIQIIFVVKIQLILTAITSTIFGEATFCIFKARFWKINGDINREKYFSIISNHACYVTTSLIQTLIKTVDNDPLCLQAMCSCAGLELIQRSSWYNGKNKMVESLSLVDDAHFSDSCFRLLGLHSVSQPTLFSFIPPIHPHLFLILILLTQWSEGRPLVFTCHDMSALHAIGL